MRLQSFFATAVAAAVAAVVFVSATQPVEAALVTIDNFTLGSGTETVTNSTDALGSATIVYEPLTTSLGVRQMEVVFYRETESYPPITSSVSVGAGVGTMSVQSTGTSAALMNGYAFLAYLPQSSPTADLLAMTAGDAQVFKIVTGSACFSNVSPSLLPAFVDVSSLGAGTGFGRVDLPSFWAPNTTYFIPFSAFPGVDFTLVQQVSVGFGNSGAFLLDTTPLNATAEFTLVAVPEPSQMVFVAGIGATLGAWRLRKLRRNRAASEAAAV